MIHVRKFLAPIIISVLLLLTLCGCSQTKSPVTKSGVYFDTLISITLYEKNSSALIDECFNIAERYEKTLSKTLPDSDVSKINNSYNEWVPVSFETCKLILDSIDYENISEGRFSVVCGALTELWDVSNQGETPKLPSDKEINAAKKLCGSSNIKVDAENSAVMVLNKGAKIDLGAVAKGYIADQMKAYLLSQGVNSGIIELGGNVLLIGNNITKESGLYTIGITKPFSGNRDIITTVSESDVSIVTSGNYQRYFEYNNKIYHHIIDLRTGYPADTGLNSASVICPSSEQADIMSTVCFLLGKEKGTEIISSLPGFKVIFVSSENTILE